MNILILGSKGFLGECGRRGGYMEMVHIVSIIYIYIYLACCMITIINKSKLTIIIIKHIYIYIQNNDAKEEMYKKYGLRFITHNTRFNYEVEMLVSMMHWDEFNNAFKLILLNNSLQKKGTTFQEQYKKAALMKKEQDRLFDIGEVKVRIRKRRGKWCWNFLAATHIQRWWLRINRKFHIYKNMELTFLL